MSKKQEAVRIIAVALTTKEDAACVVRETVTLQLDMEAAIVARDKAVKDIAELHNKGIDAKGAEITEKMAQLQQWATAHPEEFPKGLRSLKIDGHSLGWELGNYATTTLKGWTWKKVVEALSKTRKRIREKYLRVVTQPNKEAMIADRRRAKLLASFGVEIVQGETFFLSPNRQGQADPTLQGETQEAREGAKAA
jgi:phage host-nuclease inhibitor protein Gam